MSKKKKILILRLGALGDVIMTTVIATAVKSKYPDCEIHYLTQSDIAPVLDSHPHIDRIIQWNRENRKSLKQFVQIVKILFSERYDIIFNLTYVLRNMLLCMFSCPRKIVFRKYTNRSWVEDFFYTAKTVIKDINCPERLYLGLNDISSKKIEKFMSKYRRPYITIAPCGDADKNRAGRIWNIEKTNELANKLIQLYNGTVFIIGSKSERDYHEKINGEGIKVCSGEFDITESSVILAKSDLVISGDSAPAHIAAAHNVKTLVLLGSTSPDKIKPYGPSGYYISADYECKYCWKKKCKKLKSYEKYTPCMEHISVEDVIEKIKEEKFLEYMR